MAIIKFGSIVTSASGSAGGSTVQAGHQAPIWRNKPQQTYSRTTSQALIRGYNKTMQAGWRNLTDQDRTVWNDFARVKPVMNRSGDKHIISGHSLYMKYQFYQLICGLPFLSSPSEYVDLSAYCQQAQCYIRRVLQDGGQVNDMQLTDDLFRYLISISAENTFEVGFMPYAGVKLRDDSGDLYVEKWYNLFTSNDLIQATPASQPRYGQNQIGGLDILTFLLSKMYFSHVTPQSYIQIAGDGGSGSAGFISLNGFYLSEAFSGLRYRGGPIYGLSLLIGLNYRVDSILVTVPTVNVWRNNIASVSNPQPASLGTMDGVGARGGTNYWNGSNGGILASTSPISTAFRTGITTFLQSQYSIP